MVERPLLPWTSVDSARAAAEVGENISSLMPEPVAFVGAVEGAVATVLEEAAWVVGLGGVLMIV